jgi:hypothetical protein
MMVAQAHRVISQKAPMIVNRRMKHDDDLDTLPNIGVLEEL